MEKQQFDKIKTFVDSDINSEVENQFTAKELQGYFDKKLKHQYAEKLEADFNIKKQNAAMGAIGSKSGAMAGYVIMALIGMALIFAVYYFFGNTNKKETEIQYAYQSELYTPIDVNVRGSLSNHQLLVTQLTQAYEQKDFPTVIAEYQNLKSNAAPKDLNIEQMAGIAYGSTGAYDAAVNIFNGILSTKESSYSNHSTVRYLLGLIYMLQEDEVSAKNIFQQIKNGDYKYEAVQKIIEGLE